MTFSNRTSWQREHNRITELLEQKRKQGETILDLTISNPTQCGFRYPEKEILESLAQPQSLQYEPNPLGLLSAREAIAEYYAQKNITIPLSNIFLTASTSEAYSYIFKLLCNPGDAVLVPQPSYPLFEYLCRVNDVGIQHYSLRYTGDWCIDVHSISKALTPQTKAIVLINPHNPTGEYIKKDEYQRIVELARRNNLALIVDEVFLEYCFSDDNRRLGSTAGLDDVLTFTLNGVSKMIGMPQLKLGWIILSGKDIIQEASGRLEILCDTYLSVNTSVQVALPKLLEVGKTIQSQILQRITTNYNTLRDTFGNKPQTGNHKPSSLPISMFESESGWYALLKFPQRMTDEEWVLHLLEQQNVYVFPGFFFDFEEKSLIVVSLLTEPEKLQEGVLRMVASI